MSYTIYVFFDVARFRNLVADLGPRWASLELVGAFILSFSPNNPVRRWLENGWAQTEANREAWQTRRDAE
ncbi:hypothetical protein ABIA85_005917 [Bradyrhizobium sp. LA6.10]|uniref:hypothetical protein n=1 Tax=Bradyrhizobium sp. LA6.10 TaxID=3156318 RepID=UPI00339561F1